MANSTARATIVGALIGAAAVVIVGILGALIASSSDARNERDVARRAAKDARAQADLSDLRVVLDDTARHIARATRNLDVLRDRCFTAIREGVAVRGRPAKPSSLAYKRWQTDLLKTYRDSLDLRVDRERLRIRLRNPRILALYVGVEDILGKARQPCARARLRADAPAVNQRRLDLARRRTTRYFAEVVKSAGTQLR